MEPLQPVKVISGRTVPPPCRARACCTARPWWGLLALGVNALCAPAQAPGSEQALTPTPAPLDSGVSLGPSPDNQRFHRYLSPENGFSLDVPVGWQGSDEPGRVRLSDGLNGIRVRTVALNAGANLARCFDAAQAEARGFGGPVTVTRVKETVVPAGRAVMVKFRVGALDASEGCAGQPLDGVVYLIRRSGRLYALTLWAPAGSGHRELWRRLLESWQWT